MTIPHQCHCSRECSVLPNSVQEHGRGGSEESFPNSKQISVIGLIDVIFGFK